MSTARPKKKHSPARSTGTLMVRLDQKSKRAIAAAAVLRGISISDYVRSVVVSFAKRELQAAEENVITLTPDEQLAFWNALNEPVRLTKAQRELGAIIRGER